ncbi:hypothetical protein ACFPIF_09130 [Brevundimonas faecalis]|uniref:hypothetical protein n=1 Tax=Brevundimonas faecalis TaxID=947378 RepID=UPI003621C21A
MIALTLLLAAADPSAPCVRALAAAPGMACVEAGRGVVLAEDESEARRLAAHAVGAEARFAQGFSGSSAPYAVIMAPSTSARNGLKAAGFQHVLSWPAPRSFNEAARSSLETGARRFAASQGMTEAQTRQVVERALSQLPTPEAQAALDAGMVPHELGHLWFTAAFWPDAAASETEAPRHYGGPGPDWLDEAAAVFMEDEATADQRRDQFRALMRGETLPALGPTDGRSVLLDLAGFLGRDHPGLARAVSVAPDLARSGGVGVSFTPAGAGPAPATLERLFYVQARVFSDYLIRTSGRPAVLAEIAQATAGGQDFETWLARRGPDLGLPSSLAALQTDWDRFARNF